MSTETALRAAIEKFTHWRAVFADWQLGTRAQQDPECQAVRDHRELTMLLRAEVNALTRLLIDHQSITVAEFQQALLDEIQYLDADYEQKFPGMRSSAEGIVYDLPTAAETMRHWRP